jgi:hypothetical protein
MGVAVSMLLSVAAVALFALAMARHHRQLFGHAPSTGVARACRLLGTLLIAAAPLPWIAQTGPAMALVTWLFCGLPLAALVVVAAFTAFGVASRPEGRSR